MPASGWPDTLALPPSLKKAVVADARPIVITGAGGWLGRSTLAMLADTLDEVAFNARVQAFGSDDRLQMLPSGRAIEVQRLERLAEASFGPAHYFHFAFLTKDRLATVDQASFVRDNTAIGDVVASTIARNGLAGLCVPSSGAVYGRGTRTLDFDLATNPYGSLKLLDEQRFGSLAAKFGAPVCLPRVFNLAGPYINKVTIYALATMIGDGLADRPIEIRASRPVLRSYLHVGDLLRLAAGMLFDPRPEPVAVFDAAGERSVELADLAACVARVLGRRLTVARPPFDPAHTSDTYVGEVAELEREYARHGMMLRDLDTQIRDTAAFLADVGSTTTGR